MLTSISWGEEVTFRSDDHYVRCVLGQRAYLDFHRANSRKQMFTERHITPDSEITIIILHFNGACLAKRQHIPIL
jgi:hypothetical protein